MPAALKTVLAWPPCGLGTTAPALVEFGPSQAASHFFWGATLFDVSIAAFFVVLDPLEVFQLGPV